jgi:hypothetical protein
VTIAGQWTPQLAQEFAFNEFENLRELTRSQYAPEWAEGLDGVTQVIALALLSERLERRIYAPVFG